MSTMMGFSHFTLHYNRFESFLISCDGQFGFKKGRGCSMAFRRAMSYYLLLMLKTQLLHTFFPPYTDCWYLTLPDCHWLLGCFSDFL